MGRSARWARSAPGQHGVERAGEPVSVGVGAACLGDPHSATLGLAYTMAKAGGGRCTRATRCCRTRSGSKHCKSRRLSSEYQI
jgi:hypothetical protein